MIYGSKYIKQYGKTEEIFESFISKKLNINKEQIYSIKTIYEAGLLFFNVLNTDIKSVKIKNFKVKYTTDPIIFDLYQKEINNDFTILENMEEDFLFSLGNCFDDSISFYYLTKENFEKLKKELKNVAVKKFEEKKDKIALSYADSPVDIKLINEDKIELKYHPVNTWIGDEFRGEDIYRSAVDKNKIIKEVLDFNVFIPVFNEEIKDLFFKYAEKVAEIKTAEIKLNEEEKKEVNQILHNYLLKEKEKGFNKIINRIKEKLQDNQPLNTNDIFNLLKIEKDTDVNIHIPDNLCLYINKFKSSKTFLVKYNGEYKLFNKDYIKSTRISVEFLEYFSDNIKNFFEMDKQIFKKYNLLDFLLKKYKLDKNMNLLLDKKYIKENKEFENLIKFLNLKTYAIDLNNKYDFIFLKLNNKPEFENKTGISNGVIIGKKGHNIKKIAKITGFKFLKMI